MIQDTNCSLKRRASYRRKNDSHPVWYWFNSDLVSRNYYFMGIEIIGYCIILILSFFSKIISKKNSPEFFFDGESINF